MNRQRQRKRRPIFINESLCVFCRNANVNYLEEKFKFFTAKICGHQVRALFFPMNNVDVDADADDDADADLFMFLCDRFVKSA